MLTFQANLVIGLSRIVEQKNTEEERAAPAQATHLINDLLITL